jgi:hypothetical protein
VKALPRLFNNYFNKSKKNHNNYLLAFSKSDTYLVPREYYLMIKVHQIFVAAVIEDALDVAMRNIWSDSLRTNSRLIHMCLRRD